MTIDIGSVFEDGFDELLSRKGAVLGGVFLLVSLASTFLTQSFALAILDVSADRGGATASELETVRDQLQYGLDIGLGPALVGLLLFILVAELVRIVAVRALGDRTTSALEPRHYGDGLLKLFVYRLLAGIILLFLYGFLLLAVMIPTAIFPPLFIAAIPLLLYVAIPLYFVPIAVVVDEIGPLTAIQRAWDYGSGNRIRLLLVAIGVGVINLVLSSPTFLVSAPGDLQGGAGAGAFAQSGPALLVTVIVGAISSVFVVAMGVAAYANLKDDAAGTAETAGGSQEFGSNTEF